MTEEIKKISFEQYVARRPQIKPHHVQGMKAFVINVQKPRTETQWDEIFTAY